MSCEMSSCTLIEVTSVAEAYAVQNGLFKMTEAVNDIAKGLCQRNSRFQYIHTSSVEFHYGDSGMASAVLQLLLYDDREEYSESLQSLQDIFHPEVFPQDISIQDISESAQFLTNALQEIIDAAIYEILNVYDLELTVDQVPNRDAIEEHLELLQCIYEKSKDARVRPTSATPKYQSKKGAAGFVFQYPNSLVSLSEEAGNVLSRVLHILPGSKESCIQCKLEVRNLDEHGLEQALSYVWGSTHNPKCIWVEDKPFWVTANLHDALIALRYEHATRTIWVDAICINQSDPEEKAHQVRLMGKIYSKAKMTVIWLGGRVLESGTAMTDPSDVLAPLPPNLVENMVDQYDLVGILERVREIPIDESWDKKRNTLSVMLMHCLNVIMSQEWWERVWTIQEAVLPREHPIIMFRGYEFSFGDFISATKLVLKIRCSMSPKLFSLYDETPDTILPRNALAYQMVHWENHCNQHILPFFRPGQESELDRSSSFKRLFHFLLCETSSYKATDPRDKCFALQALMPSGRSALLYVDYNESKEAVFRRATARCYNGLFDLHMTTRFKLLAESQQAAQNGTDVPSWTQDFTYSAVRRSLENNQDSMTFEAYLFKEDNWQPLYKSKHLGVACFATPSTLFCSGVSIDAVCTMGFIPDLRGEDWVYNISDFLKGVFAAGGRTYWDKLPRDESITSGKKMLRWETVHGYPNVNTYKELVSLLDSIKTPPTEAPEKLTWNIILPVLAKTIILFTLGGKFSLQNIIDPRKRGMDKRLELMIGKQYFTISKGLVGISTAPIEEGDVLMAMDVAPAYFILRRVGSLDNLSPDTEKYRIVARAVVHETQDEMTARMECLENRVFQII